MKKRILLVEPNFPYPNRSKNQANGIHKNFAPIGLLKLGAMHKELGNEVRLVRGNVNFEEFIPDEILITSLFTYWSDYVWNSIEYYRRLFPDSKIRLGGIYVTLHNNTPEFVEKAERFKIISHIGVHKEAEKFLPDYSLLQGEIDHHITHAMRGCIRKCKFCGTWKLEPELRYKSAEEMVRELKEVGKNKVLFFDNNFFANPNIKEILSALADLKINGKAVTFESQSGFDGRLLEKDPELAILLKRARFNEIRIAWDNSLEDYKSVRKQIKHLNKAGYLSKEIYVFMIYNFNIPYKIMLKKLSYCKRWCVQICDCRYRPLSAIHDDYNPHSFKEGQGEENYYIHSGGGWTDKMIRDFRKRVRQHNMEIRYANGEKYDVRMEHWSAIHNTYKFFNLGRPPFLEKIDKSKKLQERIRKLNKLKNHCIRNGSLAPDFNGLSKRELDKEIQKIIEDAGFKKGDELESEAVKGEVRLRRK
ncbi:MAG: radical SAM protein [Patescibacteria group bacterium]